jgi:glycosyltransferase involved in cell wall biosynthesis
MKIGLDLREVRPRSGGIRPLLRGVLDALMQDPTGETFHVFQSEGDPPLAREGRSVAVETITADRRRSAVDERAVALGLDVLFRGFPAGFHGFPPSRQIVFIPDLGHDAFPEFFAPEVLRDRRRRFETVLRHAGAIATPSAFSRRAILEHPETRCGDVFLMPAAGPAGGGPWKEPSAGAAPPYFLFPANLWPHKNHRRVLQAFRQFVATNGGAIGLVLTGDPADWAALAPEAAGLPVRHLGFVPDEAMPGLYRGATALLFCSLLEGFGLPVLEAFHHGIPVLGSDRGSLPEVAGEAMLACDPTDVPGMAAAMRTIATDARVRDRLVHLGRLRLAAYSWDRSAAALRAALGRAAERGRSDTAPAHAAWDRHREPAPTAPVLSIVIDLTDHRGSALMAVDSATRRQDWPRGDLEVIVVSDGKDRALEGQVRGRLGAGDRLISKASASGVELTDMGARAARGRILLVMEGHCELAPTGARELIEFFATGEHDGACLSYGGRSLNAFAHMEQRLFEERFAVWSRPDQWRKVMFRGFAILRRAYLEAGGFEGRYGLFADVALAATLHAGGYRMGWAERAWVVHTNTTRYAQLRASVQDYVAGELDYLETHDRDYCARYFGRPRSLIERRSWDRGDSGAALRALAGALGPGAWRAGPGATAALAGEAARLAAKVAIGPWWPVLRAGVRVTSARLRYAWHRSRPDARYRAYTDLWDQLARLAGARRLASRAVDATRPAVPATGAPIDAFDRYRSFGFHDVERWESRAFRWSGPVAGFWLDLPPGRHHVTLETEPLRPPGLLEVSWHGRRVRHVERLDRSIRFDLQVTAAPSAGPGVLALVASPVPRRARAPTETRRLGIPLFGLRIAPAADLTARTLTRQGPAAHLVGSSPTPPDRGAAR